MEKKEILNLFHYTSLLNAFKILFSGKIYFSDLRYANDKLEKEGCEEDMRTSFIFCTSLELTSGLWLSYSGRKDGSCIEFVFKKDMTPDNLFESIDWNGKIDYVDDFIEKNAEEENFGRIKDSFFGDENEYRFLVIKEGLFSSHYLEKDINFDCLDKIILHVHHSDLKIAKHFCKGLNIHCKIVVEEINYID